jgi:thiol-disulfide isomerase/thioredoxin
MARKLRERRVRPGYIPIVLGITAVIVWVLVPVPFVRGVVVGAVLVLGALMGGGVLVARRMRRKISHHLKPPPLPMVQWDFDMSAEDIEGNRVDFVDFSGQVLILNFWATWCGPCIAEMPSLERLREATSDVEVALACVTQEPVKTVREFLEKRDIDVPIYVLDGDVPECFKSRAIPATFVLDRNGRIVLRHFGAAGWDDEGVVGFVRGLALVAKL